MLPTTRSNRSPTPLSLTRRPYSSAATTTSQPLLPPNTTPAINPPTPSSASSPHAITTSTTPSSSHHHCLHNPTTVTTTTKGACGYINSHMVNTQGECLDVQLAPTGAFGWTAALKGYKNDNQTRQFRNQKTVTVAGAKETIGSQEKMLLCKQAKKGVPLQAKQADWLEDMDEEIDEQQLETHYSYMEKIQEIPIANSGTDTEPLEQFEEVLRLFLVEADSNGGVIGLAISLPLYLVDALDLVEDDCFDGDAYDLDMFKSVSTTVRSGTSGESSVA
nr:hypothetical protein [Tanacetum cinerariifolium]